MNKALLVAKRNIKTQIKQLFFRSCNPSKLAQPSRDRKKLGTAAIFSGQTTKSESGSLGKNYLFSNLQII